MNAALNTIEMKVDAQALVNNLKLAFTSNTTFISEILQNSRRAGATEIHVDYDADDDILTILDNGRGIEDMQNLLNVAHSGWDEELKARETPYGMGFLSALFAASHVEVASRGKIVAFDTEHAMSFKQIQVHDAEFAEGTLVIMKGALKGIATNRRGGVIPEAYTRGFPVPVILNGELLPRDHAIDQMDFIETDIGQVHIRNLKEGRDPIEGFTFYLQGQDVTPERYRICLSQPNVVHLDPVLFKGRLPDRDVLIDEHAKHASKRAEMIWRQCWRRHFEGIRDEVASDHFATRFFESLKRVEAIDLLDGVDALPRQSLLDVNVYPIHTWDWEDEGSQPKSAVSRSQIESGEIKVVTAEDYKELDGGFQLANFIYQAKNLLVYEGNLGPNHWIHEHLTDLTNDDIAVHLHGVQKVVGVGGPQYGYADAVFCDTIELRHPVLGSVKTDVDGMYISAFTENVYGLTEEQLKTTKNVLFVDGNTVDGIAMMAIPKNECDGEVVRQAHTFEGEFGADEDECEDERQAFSRFLLANRPGGEAEAIRQAMVKAGISDMSSLQGKRFEIEINDDPKAGRLGALQVTMK